MLERLESIERAVHVRDNTINEEINDAIATESTIDEGVVVSFENVREGGEGGLRKRKESTDRSDTKEQATTTEYHKEISDAQSKHSLFYSLSFILCSFISINQQLLKHSQWRRDI